MVSLTSEQLKNRQAATTAYLTADGNEDLLAGARAYVKSLGIPESNVGGVSSAMSNYAIGHYLSTMGTETRAGTEGLQTTGDEVNTNLAIVPELSFGVGEPRVEEGTGNTVRDRFFNPVEATFDSKTPNFNAGDTGGGGDSSGNTGGGGDSSGNTGGGGSSDNAGGGGSSNNNTTGGGSSNNNTTGGGASNNAGQGVVVGGSSNAGGLMASDLDPLKTGQSDITADIGTAQAALDSITNLFGQPDTTIDQPATLMGQTAGLMQGQTAIQDRIGTPTVEDATLFGGQEGISQDIATAQQGITGIQAGIGTAPVDPETGDPTTLFQGQQGLMTGQTGISSAISGVGTQAGNISNDISNLQTQLRNFENLSVADRANILSTLNTRAKELKGLADTYGMQTNAIANQVTGQPAPTGMMTQSAPVAGSLPAILAAEQAQNTTTQNINRGLMDVAEQGQVGPLGPETPDTRV